MVSTLPLVPRACHGARTMKTTAFGRLRLQLHPRRTQTRGTWFAIEASGCEPIGLPHSDASATPTSGLPPVRWRLGKPVGPHDPILTGPTGKEHAHVLAEEFFTAVAVYRSGRASGCPTAGAGCRVAGGK